MSIDSGGHFGDQQRVVERIDDAGQRCSAFLAGEGVALEAAGVDDGILAAAKREARTAAGTRDRLSAVRFAGPGDDAIWLIDVSGNWLNFSAANSEANSLSDRFEMLAEIDGSHFTETIQISLT